MFARLVSVSEARQMLDHPISETMYKEVRAMMLTLPFWPPLMRMEPCEYTCVRARECSSGRADRSLWTFLVAAAAAAVGCCRWAG